MALCCPDGTTRNGIMVSSSTSLVYQFLSLFALVVGNSLESAASGGGGGGLTITYVI